MSTITEHITRLLTSKFAEDEQFKDYFLVEIKEQANQTAEVFLDSDQGVSIENCARLNRYLRDELEALGMDWALEVSSPGLSNPLRLPRQYRKNIGRELAVDLLEPKSTLKGQLIEVKDDSIVLEYEEKVAVEGKKKKELMKLRHDIPFANIKKAVVKISFK